MPHQDTLGALRADIARTLADRPNPTYPTALMPGDRWIRLSALQKAIRRGETGIAQSAAFSLLATDKAALFRRLPVIALEDVGMGAINCTMGVIAASTSAAWRKSAGGDAVVLHALVAWMCRAPKCRAADNAILAAKDHPAFDREREHIGGMDTAALVDEVGDNNRSTIGRIMAAWRLAGTHQYPSDHWPGQRGDMEALCIAYERAGVPPAIIAACRAAMGLLRYPLPISLPVIWTAFQNQPSEVQERAVPPTVLVNGIPTYALGKHTSLGKRALRLLAERGGGLRDCLEPHFRFADWPGALGAAQFHAESALVARKRAWAEAEMVQHLGAAGDLHTFGTLVDAVPTLLNSFSDHLHDLDNIRVELLESATLEFPRRLL